MKIIKKLNDISFDKKLFITIGNFDGVHYGHLKILEYVCNESCAQDGRFVVITFVPHPLLILRPRNNYLINSYEERRELLKMQGVEYLMEVEFGRDFSNLSPAKFLDQFILNNAHEKKLFLGHDFAFGAGKTGDYNFAKSYCSTKKSVSIELLPKFELDQKEISSSVIRSSLLNGKIEDVNGHLKRLYFVTGTVIKGQARGRSIGFPTANIEFSKQRIVPAKGVYVTMTRIDDQVYQSVTNIGTNPTFEKNEILHIETHLLDFDQKIYGKTIKISFLKKLREEKKFHSVNDLVSQIKHDVIEVKSYFKAAYVTE